MDKQQYENLIVEMKGHIADTIRLTVNGKIDKISTKLDAYILRAEPSVKFFENISVTNKIVMGIIGLIGTLGAAYIAIKTIFHL